jgi:rhodanese-related sulfurtransferase
MPRDRRLTATGKDTGSARVSDSGPRKRITPANVLVVVVGLSLIALIWVAVALVPSVGAAEARALLAEHPDSVLLLDVRPAAKAASDPVPGALSIPYADLRAMKRAAELPSALLGKRILVICETGRMAVPAVRRLRTLGIRGARRIAGGLRTWRTAEDNL